MIIRSDENYSSTPCGHFGSSYHPSTPSAVDANKENVGNGNYRQSPEILLRSVSAATKNSNYSPMVNLNKSISIPLGIDLCQPHLIPPFCFDCTKDFEVDDNSDPGYISPPQQSSNPSSFTTSKNALFHGKAIGTRSLSQNFQKASSPIFKSRQSAIHSTLGNTRQILQKDEINSRKARLTSSIDRDAFTLLNSKDPTPRFLGMPDSLCGLSLDSSRSFNNKRESFTTLDQIEMEFYARMNNSQAVFESQTNMESLPLNENQFVTAPLNITIENSPKTCRRSQNTYNSELNGIRPTKCKFGKPNLISPDKIQQVSFAQSSRESVRPHNYSSSWASFAELESLYTSSSRVRRRGFASQSLNALSPGQVSCSSPITNVNSICSLPCISSSSQFQKDQKHEKLENNHTSRCQGNYNSSKKFQSSTKGFETFDTLKSSDSFTLSLVSCSRLPIVAPQPFSPARELRLKNSVPHLMKELPSLPLRPISIETRPTPKPGSPGFEILLQAPSQSMDSEVIDISESKSCEKLNSEIKISSGLPKENPGLRKAMKNHQGGQTFRQSISTEQSLPEPKLKTNTSNTLSPYQFGLTPSNMEPWDINPSRTCRPITNAIEKNAVEASQWLGFKKNSNLGSLEREAHIKNPSANAIPQNDLQNPNYEDLSLHQGEVENFSGEIILNPRQGQSYKASMIMTTRKTLFNGDSVVIRKQGKSPRTSYISKRFLFSKPSRVMSVKFGFFNDSPLAGKRKNLKETPELGYKKIPKTRSCFDNITFSEQNNLFGTKIPISSSTPEISPTKYQCRPILNLKKQIKKQYLVKKLRDFVRDARQAIVAGVKIARRGYKKKENAR